MFTGIIEELGQVIQIVSNASGIKLTIHSEKLIKELEEKKSIAINGCCLTCIQVNQQTFTVDVVSETLKKTCLNELKIGSKVNLELPLQMNGRLDGHLVQGHVDHTGTILSKKMLADESCELVFEAPLAAMRYIVEKGSIAIDGVSLTVWNTGESFFSVALIPYSAKNTTLGMKSVGEKVNLEIDLIAKYIEKFLGPKG